MELRARVTLLVLRRRRGVATAHAATGRARRGGRSAEGWREGGVRATGKAAGVACMRACTNAKSGARSPICLPDRPSSHVELDCEGEGGGQGWRARAGGQAADWGGEGQAKGRGGCNWEARGRGVRACGEGEAAFGERGSRRAPWSGTGRRSASRARRRGHPRAGREGKTGACRDYPCTSPGGRPSSRRDRVARRRRRASTSGSRSAGCA